MLPAQAVHRRRFGRGHPLGPGTPTPAVRPLTSGEGFISCVVWRLATVTVFRQQTHADAERRIMGFDPGDFGGAPVGSTAPSPGVGRRVVAPGSSYEGTSS